MKRVISCLLIGLLAVPALASDKTPEQQVRGIKPGREMEVTLISGEKLSGRRGILPADSFTMNPLKTGSGTGRSIEFSELHTVHRGIATVEHRVHVGVLLATAVASVFVLVLVVVLITGFH